MRFDPDIKKQGQEVIFSQKLQKSNYLSLPPLVTQSEIKKHLRKFLDSELDFKEHIQNVLKKVSKTIGLLLKLQRILPRPPLIIVNKYSIRLHLN